MTRGQYPVDEILAKLRDADRLRDCGVPAHKISKELCISELTLHRWREKYRQGSPDAIAVLLSLTEEITRLRDLVAAQADEISSLRTD